MLNEKIEKALNDQINAEYYSSYLYLSMSAYFESVNLQGFADWTRMQAQEEEIHYQKFFDYIVERGGRVMLDAIEKPPAEWASPLAAFEDVYKHECYITGRINDLVCLALEEKDHATHNMLQWFVAEQVEEEASADGVLQQLKLVGQDKAGLFMIDQELTKRVAPGAGEKA